MGPLVFRSPIRRPQLLIKPTNRSTHLLVSFRPFFDHQFRCHHGAHHILLASLRFSSYPIQMARFVPNCTCTETLPSEQSFPNPVSEPSCSIPTIWITPLGLLSHYNNITSPDKERADIKPQRFVIVALLRCALSAARKPDKSKTPGGWLRIDTLKSWFQTWFRRIDSSRWYDFPDRNNRFQAIARNLNESLVQAVEIDESNRLVRMVLTDPPPEVNSDDFHPPVSHRKVDGYSCTLFGKSEASYLLLYHSLEHQRVLVHSSNEWVQPRRFETALENQVRNYTAQLLLKDPPLIARPFEPSILSFNPLAVTKCSENTISISCKQAKYTDFCRTGSYWNKLSENKSSLEECLDFWRYFVPANVPDAVLHDNFFSTSPVCQLELVVMVVTRDNFMLLQTFRRQKDPPVAPTPSETGFINPVRGPINPDDDTDRETGIIQIKHAVYRLTRFHLGVTPFIHSLKLLGLGFSRTTYRAHLHAIAYVSWNREELQKNLATNPGLWLSNYESSFLNSQRKTNTKQPGSASYSYVDVRRMNPEIKENFRRIEFSDRAHHSVGFALALAHLGIVSPRKVFRNYSASILSDSP